ncbi:right-handed parallel beta-helix repeat-containing protein [Candidatus Acetothermia bacterium]|nr:right-handed parallel beta-helix repeat-containing protein [Candidatus Acetothermia bacterium]
MKRFKSTFLFSVLLLVALPSLGSTPEHNFAAGEELGTSGGSLPLGSDLSSFGFSRTRGSERLVKSLAQAQQTQQISPVVQIAAFQGNQFLQAGSGFILDLHGLILTNSHILHRVSAAGGTCKDISKDNTADRIFILVTEKGIKNVAVPRYVATVVSDRNDVDLALLQISERIENTLQDLTDLKNKIGELTRVARSPAQVAAELSQKLSKEEQLVPWDAGVLHSDQWLNLRGFPSRLDDSVLLDSRHAQVTTINETTGLIYATLDSAPGMSGGPVIDRDNGLVVGILCAIQGNQTVARTINVAAAVGLLQGINRAPVATFEFPKNPNPGFGQAVSFNGTASVDPDGQPIKEYRWQWRFDKNGNNQIDPDEPVQEERSGSNLKQVTFTFPASSFDPLVTLTVKKDDELSNSISQKIVMKRECQVKVKYTKSDGSTATIDGSIQQAIRDALAGTTVNVSAGTCQEQESLDIKKSLTLKGVGGVGADQTILVGNGEDPAIYVHDTKNVTITGVTVKNGAQGIRIFKSTGVNLNSNKIQGNLQQGVEISTQSTAKLVDNQISNNGREGISLVGTEAVELLGNTVSGNGDKGLIIEKQSKATLSGEILRDNSGIGILVVGGSELRTLENGLTVTGTKLDPSGDFGHAIDIEDGPRGKAAATIIGGRVEGNAGVGLIVTNAAAQIGGDKASERNQILKNGSDGIRVQQQADAIVVNNLISENSLSGILVMNEARATIQGNQIQKTSTDKAGAFGRGIDIERAGDGNIIQSNTIAENAEDGLLIFNTRASQIKDNTVNSNAFEGIFVLKSSELLISSNTIQNTRAQGKEGRGISVEDSNDITLEKNRILENEGTGIIAFGSKVLKVEKNTIWDNRIVGIDIHEKSSAILKGNEVLRTKADPPPGTGIEVSNDSAVDLEGNTASQNPRAGITIFRTLLVGTIKGNTLEKNGQHGLIIRDDSKVKAVDNNTIRENGQHGIYLYKGVTTTSRGGIAEAITNNTITGNQGYGIYADDFSEVLKCEGNTLSNNGADLKTGVSPNLQGKCK